MTQPISGTGQFGRKVDVVLNRVCQNYQVYTSFFICLCVAKIIQVHGEMSGFLVGWFINDFDLYPVYPTGEMQTELTVDIPSLWVDLMYSNLLVGLPHWWYQAEYSFAQ